MDINQIQELIRMVSKAKLTEFTLKDGDFELVIRNQSIRESAEKAPVMIPAAQPVVTVAPPAPAPVAAPPAPATPAAPAAAAPAEDDTANLLTVKSPMVGTFYRSSAPEKPPFVKVGDVVEVGDTVCIIEAMKLFNEIESDVKGKIVKVLVDDASPVEYDQPLFLVDPA
ncbi:MAG: acetyl-CoA carboxylase biotin carboxyl carrier protein [Bacteroidetes bacterium]|nr:MAG: acetyl-CoA carboxylase biotin carboxyl carrier protein [Bacteroidota bacterium]